MSEKNDMIDNDGMVSIEKARDLEASYIDQ